LAVTDGKGRRINKEDNGFLTVSNLVRWNSGDILLNSTFYAAKLSHVSPEFGLFFLSSGPLFAGRDFNIKGQNIPIIEGASILRQESRQGTYSTIVYTTVKALKDAAAFYQDFFKANGFETIGAEEGNEYNVSVKKGDAVFTLRIYTEQGQTAIQFIW